MDAAFAVLASRGYAGFAIEAVAHEAGAGKTTVYRWWKTKAELAIDAFLHATTEELRLQDSSSAQADFRAQITELGKLLRGERGYALAAMLGGARTDPVLARTLGERWIEPRKRWGFERMMRAQAAGELREGVQPSAALAVLYGPLYSPLLFGGRVPDDQSVEAYLDVACFGIFASV